jgi:hypothetical protein
MSAPGRDRGAGQIRLPGKAGIRVALSLARIVLLNVLALLITAGVTAHVLTRSAGPRPAPLARSVLAAHPTTALSTAPPVEIDLEIAPPRGTTRQPE